MEMTKERVCYISTVDNPYSPAKQFDEWNNFDISKGYYSSSKLARVARLSDDMSQVEIAAEIERAIDSLVANDPLSIFMKVVEEYETEED